MRDPLPLREDRIRPTKRIARTATGAGSAPIVPAAAGGSSGIASRIVSSVMDLEDALLVTEKERSVIEYL